MSKENVFRFFDAVENDDSMRRLLADADPESVIHLAANSGFKFTAGELQTVLKELLYAAKSLPRGWGWPLARRMGLVRDER